MERLTSERGNRCEICAVADNGKCLLNNTFPCAEYKIYAKLAAYEDTGLEPEEILQLKTAVSDIKADVDELYEKQKFLKFLESKGVDIQASVNWMCDIFDALNDEIIDIDRLRELVQADRKGRCVVLPCKPGQLVWTKTGGKVSSHKIRNIQRNSEGDFACSMLQFPLAEFGKTVFLTREEAERALEEYNG